MHVRVCVCVLCARAPAFVHAYALVYKFEGLVELGQAWCWIGERGVVG